MQGEAQLAKIVGATLPPSSLASRLHRRQQKADKAADDRNHDKEFDKTKARRCGTEGRERPADWHCVSPQFLMPQNIVFEESKSSLLQYCSARLVLPVRK